MIASAAAIYVRPNAGKLQGKIGLYQVAGGLIILLG